MKSILRSCALAVALPTLVAAADNRPPVVTFAEPNAAAASVELLAEPPSYDLPASDDHTTLEVAAGCSPTRLRGIDVTLRWEVRLPRKEAHRVDISMFRDGFEKGRYLTSGELPGGSGELVFEGAEPGIYYYWRVLTKTPSGWVVSGNGRFDAPICPVDEVRE